MALNQLRQNESEFPEFVKYESICSILGIESTVGLLGENFEVYEKGDGGNCQVRTHNYRVLGGSRSRYLKGKNIYTRPWFSKFIKWMYSNDSLYNLPSNFVMFGEWLGNHTIKYNPEFRDRFFLIDVFDINEKRFIPYLEAKDRLEGIGIKDVRFFRKLLFGRLDENEIKRVLEEPSDFYNGPKEGLVIKDYYSQPQQFWKIYHSDFIEKRKFLDGNIDYLPPARYRKNYYRLIEQEEQKVFDEKSLVKAVIENVRAEENVELSEKSVRNRLRDYLKKGELSDIVGKRNLKI